MDGRLISQFRERRKIDLHGKHGEIFGFDGFGHSGRGGRGTGYNRGGGGLGYVWLDDGRLGGKGIWLAGGDHRRNRR